ncbi:MAG: 3-deoxy-D-manno-octulosonic acid transferase [Pirellula sp.]
MTLLVPLLLDAAYALLLILVSPWVLWRRIVHGRYRQGWSAKLAGAVAAPKAPTASGDSPGPVIWFHAVSVGELQVIRPLIERAEKESPAPRIVVTTSTDSGYELACKLYARHTVSFAPLDFSWAVRRAVHRIGPSLLVLAELELWPNWIREVHRRGIPIALVNARLSEPSLRGYQRIGWIARGVVQRLTWVGAQSDSYRNRFLTLGCDASRVVVTGNIKFDGATFDRHHAEVIARREALGLRKDETVWLCGSTQSPEEQLCIDAYLALRPRFPKLRLMLVPRHAERFDEVARMIERTQLPWLRRSQMTASPDAVADSWSIFLADSVGELRWWWGLADVGFVGGSFGSRGGQNMIEPCAYGVVTSFGPNTRNFADVVQILLEADAATQLASSDELVPWLSTMLEHPDAANAMRQRAVATVAAQRGAVERTWSALLQLLGRQSL